MRTPIPGATAAPPERGGGPYRGRFAPSPTGTLHLGAARTALLAWLRARQAGGAFILRVDDLDRARVREGSLRSIQEDLDWLGLDFDEGPDQGGARGPYIQSERLEIYERAFERLKAAGHLYPCTCTRAELAGAASAPHGEDAAPYPGTCRRGPAKPGRPAAWRFRMDAPQPFEDALAGAQEGLRDDFVVRRSDGVFAYQLASAVDDAGMGVSEVVRGADLLPSSSRQAVLLKALGEPLPAWLHLPLLLGPDGSRLGKRHASISLAAYRAAGSSAESMLGLLAASAGLGPGGEAVDLKALLGRFSLSALNRMPARFEGPWPGGAPALKGE